MSMDDAPGERDESNGNPAWDKTRRQSHKNRCPGYKDDHRIVSVSFVRLVGSWRSRRSVDGDLPSENQTRVSFLWLGALLFDRHCRNTLERWGRN